MERWSGKVAVVTGAAGGIGSAIVRQFVKYGITVVGIDRDEQKLLEFKDEIKNIPDAIYYNVVCDLADGEDIVNSFKWIEENVGPISILVNNAVFCTATPLLNIEYPELNKIFQTNVIAPILCSKETVNSILKNDINEGYIININSIAGCLPPYPAFIPATYSTCKHALGIISEALHRELEKKECSVKVTNLCPGWVDTNLSKFVNVPVKLTPEDVAVTCVSVIQTPPNVLIPHLLVKPVNAVEKINMK